MSTNAILSSRLSRPAKKLEKPRPLNLSQNRHSIIDTRLGTVEEIMALSDNVSAHLANGNYDRTLKANIKNLHSLMKPYGSKLEAIYKDQLDRNFVSIRNGSRDESLDYHSRMHLLELIELRATQWMPQDNSYYKHKTTHDLELVTTPILENNLNQSNLFTHIPPITPTSPPQPLLLGPGELVKSSGKYPAPTRVIGKNYCKDEVVIRNADSGKVMGIKGRRVHMIEELSETVISFQRVNPGAKERLVQITGPTEDKINYARQLMEDTIRRNASPVRGEGDPERPGSSSSLNTDSDDSMLLQNPVGARTALLHSFSTNDATLGEYKYTVTVGDESLKITGTNLDLVRTAKLVLDEYFSPDNEQLEFGFDDSQEVFQHIDPHPYLTTQDSEESENTFKAPIQNSDVVLSADGGSTKETKATSGLLCYTVEQLIHYVDSPLSRQAPANWADLSRDFPSILRKSPIEWLDSAYILRNRPQENESLLTLMTNSPTVSSSQLVE